MSRYPHPRDMYLSKEIICVALAVPLLVAFGLAHSAYAFDAEDIGITLSKTETHPASSDTEVVRIVLRLTNNGNEAITLSGGYFELIDSQDRKYEASLALDDWSLCDTYIGSLNPGTTKGIGLCFEVPRNKFQYDSIIMYGDFYKSTSNSITISLVEDDNVAYRPTRSTAVPTASIPSPQSTSEDKTADRQIDWIAGISFEIPEGWEAHENTDHDKVEWRFTTQSNDHTALIDIEVNPELNSKNIEDFRSLSYVGYTTIDNNYKLEKIRVENAAPRAYIQNSIIVDEDDRQTRLGLKVIIVEHEDDIYWFGYRNNLDQFEDHLTTFNRLVSSLRIGLSSATTADEASSTLLATASLLPYHNRSPVTVFDAWEGGTYANSAGTMAFEVPQGWRIEEYTNAGFREYRIILKDHPDDHKLDVSIRAELKNGKSLFEFVDSNRARGWKLDPRMTTIISEERGLGVHSNLPVYVQYADGSTWHNGGSKPIWIKGAVLEGEDMFYYFTYAGDTTEYNDGLGVFHRMLSSLEITDRTRPPSGACLIATAAHGTELAPHVQTLREVRDGTLLSTATGTVFLSMFSTAYYSFSPTIADMERQSPAIKGAVAALASPMLHTISLMSFAEPGSEASVLAIGISVIGLNIAVYAALPATAVVAARRLRGRSASTGCPGR